MKIFFKKKWDRIGAFVKKGFINGAHKRERGAQRANPLGVGIRGDDADDTLTSACASCSRKFDHSSPRDSLLLARSGKNSLDRDGVLGVRLNGDRGARRLLPEVPGRARPACSRCSVMPETSTSTSRKDIQQLRGGEGFVLPL